jgi:hypothetical protein
MDIGKFFLKTIFKYCLDSPLLDSLVCISAKERAEIIAAWVPGSLTLPSKNFRLLRKTIRVEYQPQRYQWTITSFFLGRSKMGLTVILACTLSIHIQCILTGDNFLNAIGQILPAFFCQGKICSQIEKHPLPWPSIRANRFDEFKGMVFLFARAST